MPDRNQQKDSDRKPDLSPIRDEERPGHESDHNSSIPTEVVAAVGATAAWVAALAALAASVK